MQPDDQQAAKITLLALRATTPRLPNPAGLYVPVPGGAPLREQEMLEWLERLTKPVQCVGFDIGGMLGVGYWKLDAHATALHGQFPELEEIAPNAATMGGVGAADPVVLVAGPGETLRVSYDVLRLWSDDYVLPFLCIDWIDEDTRAAEEGAIAVVSFRPFHRDGRTFGSSGSERSE